MTKQYYLEKLDAIRKALEALPEDVRICNITDAFDNDWNSVMRIQILQHPGVTGEEVREGWCETNLHGITIGWCLPDEEADDESAV